MNGASEPLGLTPHPLRGRVLAEIHARPFTPIETPCRVLRFAFMADATGAQRARDGLTDLCKARGLPVPEPDARHFRVDLAPRTIALREPQ